MRSLLLVALFTLLSLAAPPARGYTPESGTWWNPNEPGTGIFIEVQDNFLVAAAYVYDAFGNASWYTATGFLSGNARFVGQLDAFTGGQCVGCAWRPNNDFLGAGGSIVIDFDPDDPTKARLAWGGRSNIPIERFQFYLKRPEDGSTSIQLTKMLGEWQLVLDFTSLVSSIPYYGEILLFDQIDLSESPGFFDGCRAPNSVDGFCTDVALRDHQASGFYDTATGEQVIVVEDSASTFAIYVLRVGTNSALGEFSVYNRGSNPSVFAPVRAFRTASRTFVDEGVGPSKAVAATSPRPGIGAVIDLGAWNAQPKAARSSKIAPQRLEQIRLQLEAHLLQASR